MKTAGVLAAPLEGGSLHSRTGLPSCSLPGVWPEATHCSLSASLCSLTHENNDNSNNRAQVQGTVKGCLCVKQGAVLLPGGQGPLSGPGWHQHREAGWRAAPSSLWGTPPGMPAFPPGEGFPRCGTYRVKPPLGQARPGTDAREAGGFACRVPGSPAWDSGRTDTRMHQGPRPGDLRQARSYP